MDGPISWLCHGDGIPPHLFAALRPDFLVVAPPKTGSTWLADNLRHYPGVFIPAIKELKYFSWLGRWLGPDWYLSQFAAGVGRIKGEASPSYAYLPPERIRLVRDFFPDIKVIFLLREPVARTWSHARHTCRHGEAHFHAPRRSLDDPAIDWEGGAAHEWVTAGGDYLGQLSRWLDVFPRGQLLVRFFEEITSHPERLLREVLAFLGADASISLDGFPLRERINPGVEHPMPQTVEAMLHRLWHGRTRQLTAFLREEFALVPPAEWDHVLSPPMLGSLTSPVFASAFDRRVGDVLALEEGFPEAERVVHPDHHGFRIVLRQRRLLAEGWGILLEADSLTELKERIAAHLAGLERARLDALARKLEEAISAAAAAHRRADEACERADAAHRRATALEQALYDAGRTVQHLETQVTRLRPWYRGVGKWLLRTISAGGGSPAAPAPGGPVGTPGSLPAGPAG